MQVTFPNRLNEAELTKRKQDIFIENKRIKLAFDHMSEEGERQRVERQILGIEIEQGNIEKQKHFAEFD